MVFRVVACPFADSVESRIQKGNATAVFPGVISTRFKRVLIIVTEFEKSMVELNFFATNSVNRK